jgi:4-hydroxy-2-oxoheptanedioate aldolase
VAFLKERLAREGAVLNGVLATIPSAVAAQAVASAGADFLLVDREHGPIGRESLHAMIAATAGTACGALVRVPAIDEAEVKLALDCGAEGVSFPMVRSAADVERCVALLRYPPRGRRGWGPFVAHSHYGTSPAEYSTTVGPEISCWVQVETLEAVQSIGAIVAVPGLDAVVLAPFDLSIALGVQGRFDAPRFVEAVEAVERAAAAAGIALCGVALDARRVEELTARGYRALLRGIDVFMLKEATAAFRAPAPGT